MTVRESTPGYPLREPTLAIAKDLLGKPNYPTDHYMQFARVLVHARTQPCSDLTGSLLSVNYQNIRIKN